MKLKIWDNNGKSFDRYTVRVGNDYYGMSENPFGPQSFNQYIGTYGTNAVMEGRHLGKLICKNEMGLEMLPDVLKKAIADRM